MLGLQRGLLKIALETLEPNMRQPTRLNLAWRVASNKSASFTWAMPSNSAVLTIQPSSLVGSECVLDLSLLHHLHQG
jgi:hypothetical protein